MRPEDDVIGLQFRGSGNTPHNTGLLWLHGALGLVTLLALSRAVEPSILRADIAEFQLLSVTGGLAHGNGYPIYLTLANLWTRVPLGEIPWRVGLFSALAAAATTSLLSLWTTRLTGSCAVGLIAGAVFAMSNAVWLFGTVALPYALDTFLILAILLCLQEWEATERDRWLATALFLWSLDYGVHPGAVLLGPAIVLLVVAILRSRLGGAFTVPRPRVSGGNPSWNGWWPFHARNQMTSVRELVRTSPLLLSRLAGPIAAGLAGVALCLLTWFLQDSRNVPHDCLRFYGQVGHDSWVTSLDTPIKRLHYQLAGVADSEQFFALPPRLIANHAANVVRALPKMVTPVVVPFAALGWLFLWRSRRTTALALALFMATQLAFWVPYDIADLEKHLLPVWLILFLCLGPGLFALPGIVANALRRLVPRGVGDALGTPDASGAVVARPERALVQTRRSVLVVLAVLVLAPLVHERMLNVTGAVPVDLSLLSTHALKDTIGSQGLSLRAIAGLPKAAVVFSDWWSCFALVYHARLDLARMDIRVTSDRHFDRMTALRRYDAEPAATIMFVRDPSSWLPED